MPGLLALEGVVAAQIDDHQHGPVDADGAFVVGVAAAEVDHHGHVAHLIELVGVGPLPPITIAPAGVSIRAATGPVTPGNAARCRCPAATSSWSSSRGSASGASASAAAVQGVAIHLLHQVAQPAARAAVGQRVAHLVLRAKAREPGTLCNSLISALRQWGQRRAVGDLGLDHACLMTSNACCGRLRRVPWRGFALAGIHLLRGDGQHLRQPVVAVAGRPGASSRVKRSASAGAASMLRIMWSYQRRRQLPVSSEPV